MSNKPRSRGARTEIGANNEPERHRLGTHRPKSYRPGRDLREWPGHRHRRQPEQPRHHLHRHAVGRSLAHARWGPGTTWTPIFDRAPSLGVGEPGAIAIDPTNSDILYVGTSNRNGSQFSGDATQPPAGLFKSVDGGASWIRLGSGYPLSTPSNADILFDQVINVVIVDPADSQIIYLASNSGLFVSIDGGFNWTQGTAPFGDARSLVLDQTSPTAARILFAGVTGVGVVQSTNGGQTWVTILDATNPAVSSSLSGGGFSGFRKVVVALAPPTSPPNAAGIQVLYATMVGTGVAFTAPDCIGLFQSTNQGGAWTTRATAAVLGELSAQATAVTPATWPSIPPPLVTGWETLSISARWARQDPQTQVRASWDWADFTLTPMHGVSRRRRVPSQSSIAAMTEASSGARAASTSRRSTEAVFKPHCSTTLT